MSDLTPAQRKTLFQMAEEMEMAAEAEGKIIDAYAEMAKKTVTAETSSMDMRRIRVWSQARTDRNRFLEQACALRAVVGWGAPNV